MTDKEAELHIITSTLHTAEPATRLLGGPEMYLDTASGLVNLTCVIETLEPPQSVAWYHNNTKVNTQTETQDID